MSNTQRFSNRVDNYVKYRPGYPKEILPFLNKAVGFSPDWIVADIGSGTGISTALFLDNGNTVYAVEPNGPMRNKAEELLGSDPRFISIDGTAEATTLPPSSIDLIIAGQAFHWFDPVPTKKEFHRILRPEGRIALMWNERQLSSDFEKAYETLLQEYGTDYLQVRHSNITPGDIEAFFSPSPYQLIQTPNRQAFDWERLQGRFLSSSYIPTQQDNRYNKMMADLNGIFHTYQQNGLVHFDYQTKLYIG
ncbi:MAG TPA: class I SAM-dependent methyltransferase [Puia sp.]|nr:class I SAM-dependent methyltransferase [Puia sp.]